MKIVLLGGTGGCLDLIDLIEDIQNAGVTIEIHGILEDKEIDNLLRERKIDYLGKFSETRKLKKEFYFATAIGNSKNYKIKRNIIQKLGIDKSRFPRLIHPSCIISKNAKIDEGVVIHGNSYIGFGANIKKNLGILKNYYIKHQKKIH